MESSKVSTSGEKFDAEMTEPEPTSSKEGLEETATVQVGTSTVANKAKREPASGKGGGTAEYEYHDTKETNYGTEKTPSDLDVAYRSEKRTPIKRLGWNRMGWRNQVLSSTEKGINLNSTTGTGPG